MLSSRNATYTLTLAPRFKTTFKNPKPSSTLQTRWRGRPVRDQRLGGVILEAAASTPPPLDVPMTVTSIKAALLDTLIGTDRGLTARGETKAEINELITQLESQNPTPSPAQAMERLTGSWKLVYTSNPGLLATLALSRLPFVKIGDITQTVDGLAMTAQNRVQLTVPFSRTAVTATASLEVRSPSRLQVKFEEGIVHTPELLEDIEIPSKISLMGQEIDVSNVAAALKPLQSSVRDAVVQIGTFIGRQPDLKIPISSERSQTWLLTTFLDDDTRILRGERGVNVLVKEVSIAEPVEVTIEEPTKPESSRSIEYNE